MPYTLDANDMRFATAQGFNSGDQFFAYLKDSFDTLYEEGRQGRPRMLNIWLHWRRRRHDIMCRFDVHHRPLRYGL